MATQDYKIGRMPNTDFRYEEFERLLGSFYLTLKPLEGSSDARDQADYHKAVQILKRFATKYGVQSPEDAVMNPRAQEAWGNAKPFQSNWSTLDMMGSFWRDFGVGAEPGTEGQKARYDLGRLILGVFDRKGIAKAGYEPIDGIPAPVKIESWSPEYQNRSLADVVNQ